MLTSVHTKPMQISLTSGEIMDIISCLEVQEDRAYNDENHQLASYYLNLIQQFEAINEKLKELPGEKRVAYLGMMLP